MLEGKIKIMHLIPHLGLAGMETVVYNLVKNLDRNEFTTIICCLDESGTLGEELKDLGFKLHVTNRKSGIDYSLPFKIARLIKQEEVDIVHAHNSTAWFYGVLAVKLAGGCKIAVTRHGYEKEINKKDVIINRILSVFTDRIIMVSEDLRKYLIQIEKINPRKVNKVLNGIDITKFGSININKDNIKENFSLARNDKVIGIFARLSAIKNHMYLIESMPKIIEKIKNVKLLIIGWEDKNSVDTQRLKDRCKELKISNSVFFLGVRRNIPELLSIIDVCVLCSVKEGIPLALLEAMASEKPVVATNVGGNPEVVDDGRTGFLVPLNNTDELANAIIKILNDKEIAQKMGEEGYKKARRDFSLESMLQNYMNLYEELMINAIRSIKIHSLFNFGAKILKIIINKINCLVSVGLRHQMYQNKLFILAYHRILPERSIEFNSYIFRGMVVSVEDFEKQIQVTLKNFDIVHLAEAMENIKSGYKLRKPVVAITFDDGYSDNYLYAYPILKKYNIPATIYLTTGYIDSKRLLWWDELVYIIGHRQCKLTDVDLPFSIYPKAIRQSLLSFENLPKNKRNKTIRKLVSELKKIPEAKKLALLNDLKYKLSPSGLEWDNSMMLSWDNIREMSKNGIIFGAHGKSHAILTKVTTEQAKREIIESKADIENKIGKSVELFSYPDGAANSIIIDLVSQGGFKCAFIVEDNKDDRVADIFVIARKCISDDAKLGNKFSSQLFLSSIFR